MALKEKIKNTLELEKRQINESRYLSSDEKLQLTELVSDAAECTNGFTEQEKVQHLSETTFHITTAFVKVMEQLAENNDLTKNLDDTIKEMNKKVDAVSDIVGNRVKRDVRDLDIKNVVKLILIKPWFWIFLTFFVFSPKCVELAQMIASKFG